jgi:glyoxylase-like metal-dependent hydrolase (beta-lactamase superfamily II)
MAVTVDVISIGTLSSNPFWNEQGKLRAAHATTTLIREGDRTILVDPSLPPELLVHRLDERAGLKPQQIDTIFLTNFRPVHRRALTVFEEAQWLISAEERSAIIAHLTKALEEVEGPAAEVQSAPVEIEEELGLAGRTEPAPEHLSRSVDLFPSPGATVGSCGLLVAAARTIVIAGDAVVTREHFANGRVYERCADPAQGRASFADIVEIADIIIPGHDNMIVAF